MAAATLRTSSLGWVMRAVVKGARRGAYFDVHARAPAPYRDASGSGLCSSWTAWAEKALYGLVRESIDAGFGVGSQSRCGRGGEEREYGKVFRAGIEASSAERVLGGYLGLIELGERRVLGYRQEAPGQVNVKVGGQQPQE